jgi:hypothetical protein
MKGDRHHAKYYYAAGKVGSFIQENKRITKEKSPGMGEEERLLRRSEKVL